MTAKCFICLHSFTNSENTTSRQGGQQACAGYDNTLIRGFVTRKVLIKCFAEADYYYLGCLAWASHLSLGGNCPIIKRHVGFIKKMPRLLLSFIHRKCQVIIAAHILYIFSEIISWGVRSAAGSWGSEEVTTTRASGHTILHTILQTVNLDFFSQ